MNPGLPAGPRPAKEKEPRTNVGLAFLVAGLLVVGLGGIFLVSPAHATLSHQDDCRTLAKQEFKMALNETAGNDTHYRHAMAAYLLGQLGESCEA